jgi:hypothetical protein
VALAPKAQWQATAKMIEGFEQRYADANQDNDPVMLSNIDPEAAHVGWVMPKRTDPPNIPMAIFTEITRAEQNIKDTLGMYNADVGDQGRELSGRAIEARQVPGDIATYLYPKKMSKAIEWTGKIYNDVIPFYYDTERDARLRNLDDTDTVMPINANPKNVMQAVSENPELGQRIKKEDITKAIVNGKNVNDITEGKYDVVTSTGPTFASQRAEEFEQMVKLANGKVSPLDKFLIYNSSDTPGAKMASDIYKKMVPPNLLPPKPGEQPPQPPQPNPQQQVMMAKVQLEMEKMKTERIKLQYNIVKLQNELSQSKGEVDNAVISKLEEVFNEHHPADLMPGMGEQ